MRSMQCVLLYQSRWGLVNQLGVLHAALAVIAISLSAYTCKLEVNNTWNSVPHIHLCCLKISDWLSDKRTDMLIWSSMTKSESRNGYVQEKKRRDENLSSLISYIWLPQWYMKVWNTLIWWFQVDAKWQVRKEFKGK